MIDENYIRDFDKWMENERLKIALLENDLVFLKRDIELSTRQIEVAEERIKYIYSVIEDAEKGHNKYLDENK